MSVLVPVYLTKCVCAVCLSAHAGGGGHVPAAHLHPPAPAHPLPQPPSGLCHLLRSIAVCDGGHIPSLGHAGSGWGTAVPHIPTTPASAGLQCPHRHAAVPGYLPSHHPHPAHHRHWSRHPHPRPSPHRHLHQPWDQHCQLWSVTVLCCVLVSHSSVTALCCVLVSHSAVLCVGQSQHCVLCWSVTVLCCVLASHGAVLCVGQSQSCVLCWSVTVLCCVLASHGAALCVDQSQSCVLCWSVTALCCA